MTARKVVQRIVEAAVVSGIAVAVFRPYGRKRKPRDRG